MSDCTSLRTFLYADQCCGFLEHLAFFFTHGRWCLPLAITWGICLSIRDCNLSDMIDQFWSTVLLFLLDFKNDVAKEAMSNLRLP